MTEQFLGLVAAFAAAPSLPGAVCKGHHELWDETADPGVIEWTTGQCLHRCPAYTACAAWAAGLKPADLHGVVAGVVYGAEAKRGRPRRKAAS